MASTVLCHLACETKVAGAYFREKIVITLTPFLSLVLMRKRVGVFSRHYGKQHNISEVIVLSSGHDALHNDS